MNEVQSSTNPRAGGGRYRRVRSRLWAEAPFAGLTEGEKLVALYLLTGPQTTATGLYRLSVASAAEDLGCSMRAFQRRLDAVVRALKWQYDAVVRVLWLPEWLDENSPANPNVVRAWRSCFDEIPDCALKRKAWAAVRAVLAPRGESFLKPFPELLGEPLSEPLPEAGSNGLPNPPVPVPEGATVGPSRLDRRVESARQTSRMVASLQARQRSRGQSADATDISASPTEEARASESGSRRTVLVGASEASDFGGPGWPAASEAKRSAAALTSVGEVLQGAKVASER